jgi:hypothetical protein
MADVLKKSFWGDERKFLEPLMRFARGDMRDHMVSHKNDHGASYRRYGVSPWRSWLKINLCEIFGVVRFSTFATLSPRKPDIRQKEAEAETRRQGSDPLRRKGGNRGNCLARRGPRPANFHPRPSREPAGSTIKFAQSKFKREMIVLKGCSASGAGTNPPRRSVDPIAIIHS